MISTPPTYTNNDFYAIIFLTFFKGYGMLELSKKSGEKKVEYIELIYDLIFVYIIGRNNTLLHNFKDGFIAPSAFFTYFITAVIILQIWYSTVIFINKYGNTGLQENVAIFINMYLLYYMAQGVRTDWHDYYYRFSIAWALILLNTAIQYIIKYRKADASMTCIKTQIKRNLAVFAMQIAIILASLPIFKLTGVALSPLAMVAGIIVVVAMSGKTADVEAGDFSHFTERIMLYIVFTFGEMIIAISSYFEGGFSFRSVYFSFCAFLIVAGLFLSYGFVYDNVINRELKISGSVYMLIHVLMITALNNITAALEFMRMDEVKTIPKNIFIVASIIAYFIFLFSTERYAIIRCKGSVKFFALIVLASIIFAGLAILFFNNAFVSIALAVIYIYSVFLILYINVKRKRKARD